MLKLVKDSNEQLTMTFKAEDSAAVIALLNYNSVEYALRGNVENNTLKVILDTVPEIHNGYWQLDARPIWSTHVHRIGLIGRHSMIQIPAAIDDVHGYCDACGGVERYDSFYHFSSRDNKHIHICGACVAKKYQEKLIEL